MPPKSYKGITFKGSTFPDSPYKTVVVKLNTTITNVYLPALKLAFPNGPKGLQLLVTAMTFEPLVIPFDSDPPSVENRTLPPASEPPDDPAARVTVNGFASAVPAVPVWPLPVVVNVAAGFPTTIHPPWFVLVELSVPGTE